MGLLPESKDLVSFISTKCGAIDVQPLDQSSQSLFIDFFELLALADINFTSYIWSEGSHVRTHSGANT